MIADNARFDEMLRWLGEATDRVHRRAAYYTGPGQNDIETVLADSPDEVTPPVANEDAAWEALADFDERMQRTLRIATAELTASLDQADG